MQEIHKESDFKIKLEITVLQEDDHELYRFLLYLGVVVIMPQDCVLNVCLTNNAIF